jgi:dimethylglycine dehydrogenase
VGRSLAFGYVKDAPHAPGTDCKVLILGQERAAQVLDGPAYDPDSKRPRM